MKGGTFTMSQITMPKKLVASVHGEGQHLFEPMAARCTTTTIISSTTCTTF